MFDILLRQAPTIAWMDTLHQALLVGHALQQNGELPALFFRESRQQLLLMFACNSAYRLQRRRPLLRQTQ
jgi:hypothetical protein